MIKSLKVPEDIVHKINFANLQNIPSHAEDIRHMFRATPGYVDDIHSAFEEDQQTVNVSIFRWSKVETITGVKNADDVVVGDRIHIRSGNKSGYSTVLNINDAQNCSEVVITLDTRADYA